jgi:hypothetical protein
MRLNKWTLVMTLMISGLSYAEDPFSLSKHQDYEKPVTFEMINTVELSTTSLF